MLPLFAQDTRIVEGALLAGVADAHIRWSDAFDFRNALARQTALRVTDSDAPRLVRCGRQLEAQRWVFGLEALLRFCVRQASGWPGGAHAAFLAAGTDSITLRVLLKCGEGRQGVRTDLAAALEDVLRSLNNLQEGMHRGVQLVVVRGLPGSLGSSPVATPYPNNGTFRGTFEEAVSAGVSSQGGSASASGHSSKHRSREDSATPCPFYMKTGTCAYGDICKFFHPSTIPPVLFNSFGLPLRHGEPNCRFYMQTMRCDYGPSCKYNHPEPCHTVVAERCTAEQHFALKVSEAVKGGSAADAVPPAAEEQEPKAPAAGSETVVERGAAGISEAVRRLQLG
ncbi:hypothetical protein WJX81_003098 [Elliptochloris bilobata]|uniref:C3H1-type domain-containing protein n=1 Tax=Elliptochloris bilobata TaxID=381761 RepID=A0AAW1S2G6_9CHLO